MGTIAKIVTGLGLVAGVSYFGKRKMTTEELAARGGGFIGYLKGMGQGFFLGLKHAIPSRRV